MNLSSVPVRNNSYPQQQVRFQGVKGPLAALGLIVGGLLPTGLDHFEAHNVAKNSCPPTPDTPADCYYQAKSQRLDLLEEKNPPMEERTAIPAVVGLAAAYALGILIEEARS